MPPCRPQFHRRAKVIEPHKFAKPLIVIGGGGHSRVVIDAALASGLAVAGVLDPGLPAGALLDGVPVLGGDGRLDEPAFVAAHDFVVALGEAMDRRRLSLLIVERHGHLGRVVHPSAVISEGASLNDGTVILAGVVVNTGAVVGRYCILNSRSLIEHDCLLADGCHVAPGAVLAGGVRCGEDAFIGPGATVVKGIAIGARAMVGAGAVVLADVGDGERVAGVPARRIG